MISPLQGALEPSGFTALLILAGILAAVIRRTRHLACALFLSAAVVFLTFSNGLVATMLMSHLEYAYPALQDPEKHPDVRAIVVLTAYVADDDRLPLSSRMNDSSAFRVLEAANLWFRRPDCRVIVSGSAVAARIMGEQLRALGVPENRIELDGDSATTSASAEHLRSLVGDSPMFLVTSAGHMRRAVGVFRRNGMVPIPAPTDYLLPARLWDSSWRVSAIHLRASDLAAHEYAGLAWYRLTGRI